MIQVNNPKCVAIECRSALLAARFRVRQSQADRQQQCVLAPVAMDLVGSVGWHHSARWRAQVRAFGTPGTKTIKGTSNRN
jgi:hypothetical protein